MEHEKKLNDRTKITVIPNFSVVIHQGDHTVVLSNEELTRIFVEVGTAEEKEFDATRDGCQA